MTQTPPVKKRITSRPLTVRVKTARGRKISSQRWLNRQLNDEYVIEAQRLGYRSRAAFKLIQINEKFGFLKPGKHVVDLGAAPGGWTQVAVQLTQTAGYASHVLGVDITEMEPITGAQLLQLDFLEDSAPDKVKACLKGHVDIVLSDMAASSTGHSQTDHRRIMSLAETAFEFAKEVLAENGVFLAKVLQGGTEKSLLENLKKHFTTVKHIKPAASRKDSAEMYVIAIGFHP
jgi:23S rRNA (uridine2552-2'-O)-methyltransferase